MSNFICPHCQQVIDDGSDGFTSDREIELENENKRLKNQNKRLREIIEVCQKYFDNQRVTDAWANNIKMDIDDVMGDDGMEKIDD